MQIASINILIPLIVCQCIILVISNDNHNEDHYNIPRKPPVDQTVYIRRVFKYIPEKDNWQQKFAETISKAIEEEKGEDFSHSNHEDTFHKHTNEEPHEYEKQPRTFISSDLDPHVAGSQSAQPVGSQPDAIQTNDTTVPKLDPYGPKTNIVHIPTHPDHQYANNEKGEILIHRPAPIIVNRPPTKVLVNHPPLIVKPAPVIFHRPPSVIVRQVFVKPKPEPVKMQPVYVKVIKPAPEKIYIKEHVPCDEHSYDMENSSSKHRYYPSQYNF